MDQMNYQNYQMNQGDGGKNLAIGSLVCGIISTVFCWVGTGALIPLILGIVAIILAVKSGKMAPYGRRSGIATAGLVLGIIGVVLSGIIFTCSLIACGSLGCLACLGSPYYY